MAQWINVIRNNGFVNLTRLLVLLLCEKSGALAIVEPGLTTGRPGGRQAVRQTNL